MKKLLAVGVAIVVAMVLGGTTPVLTNVGGLRNVGPRGVVANLHGFEEVPAIASDGAGRFTATVDVAGTSMSYELSYAGLTGAILQAHIHFGQHDVNGGIVLFLCSNLGNGPAGTQLCPAAPGGVVGSLTATEVIGGASAQGIPAGDLQKVLRAIRAGIAYANVHSSVFPGGEIRGQLQFVDP